MQMDGRASLTFHYTHYHCEIKHKSCISSVVLCYLLKEICGKLINTWKKKSATNLFFSNRMRNLLFNVLDSVTASYEKDQLYNHLSVRVDLCMSPSPRSLRLTNVTLLLDNRVFVDNSL